MLSIYPACFFEEENGYSVIFPDFYYLSTCVDSLKEAIEMAVDCLAGALFTSKIDGEDIPEPSGIDSVDAEKKATELGFTSKSCFVNYVSVDVEEYAKTHYNKAVKKTLTIPEWLNEAAMSKKLIFRKFFKKH